MAAGWISVLQMVPWSDVIQNAPKVADGAKKLWGAVTRQPPAGAPPADGASLTSTTGVQSLAQLQVQLAAAEAAIAELHQQMQVSSELIKDLAGQNAQLVQRAERHRVHLLGLSGAVAAVGLMALVHLGVTLWR